ncbi:MAG: hypothetical protein VX815_10305 [Gemmatimonadota bacterium]|nr:hypothetical protein [Gemmatimonadota bacterium]
MSRGPTWLALMACAIAPHSASAAWQSELEVLVLPVRVHMLTSGTVPELNSTLSEREIRQVFDEANRVWQQAGIRWEVESVLREAAAGEQAFPAARETGRSGRGRFRSILLQVCPEHQWLQGAWNVCVIREFPVPAGGVFFPERRQVLWSELNPRGQMHPTILAHELGHSLCLPHDSESPNNLMRGGPAQGRGSGTARDPSTAVELTAAQIAVARRQAATGGPQGIGSPCGDGA